MCVGRGGGGDITHLQDRWKDGTCQLSSLDLEEDGASPSAAAVDLQVSALLEGTTYPPPQPERCEYLNPSTLGPGRSGLNMTNAAGA